LKFLFPERHKMLLMEDVVQAAAMTEPLPAIAGMLPQQSFLLSSFSKVMAPGLRVGYLEASRCSWTKWSPATGPTAGWSRR
jgi:DNA-binding transcriptional MocR family regulator